MAQKVHITLEDDLPSSFRFDSVTSTEGTCSEASGVVTCSVDTTDGAVAVARSGTI